MYAVYLGFCYRNRIVDVFFFHFEVTFILCIFSKAEQEATEKEEQLQRLQKSLKEQTEKFQVLQQQSIESQAEITAKVGYICSSIFSFP